MLGSSVLILNASFEPINIVCWQRAIQLLFQDKAEVLEESDHLIRSISFTIKRPVVLRLLNYIRLPQKTRFVRFSRRNIFIRDRFQCQYCGKKPTLSKLTLDHVVPVAQGGGKTWTNIVTACMPCNQKKGGLTPKQAGLKLITAPREPHQFQFFNLTILVNKAPLQWTLYLIPNSR